MKRTSFFKLAAAVFVACGPLSLHAGQVTYEIVDLGVIGSVQTDSASIARAINSSGEVVGNATITSGDEHAFLYSGGVMHDLGTDHSGQSRSFEATKGYIVYTAVFTDNSWGIFSVLAP